MGRGFQHLESECELWVEGADKVYYPQPLCISPSPTPIPLDPSSTTLVPKPTVTPSSTTSPEKEREQQPQSPIVEVGPKEVVEVEQLKRKKNEKAKDVTE